MATDYSSLTLEELLEEFKKIPDWNRYILPEVFYEKFNLKKLQPASVMESITYTPPPYEPLNKNGKVEIRGPAEGGVREIKDFATLPTEVKLIDEETGELKDMPPPKELPFFPTSVPKDFDMTPYLDYSEKIKKMFKDQNVSYNPSYFDVTMLSPPKFDENLKTDQGRV